MSDKKSSLCEKQYVVVGQFAKTFGVSGWIKVHSYTYPPTNLVNYDPWFYNKNQAWLHVPVKDVQLQGHNIIALIEGYDSPESVRVFTGIEISVHRSQLPVLPEGEFYWYDLIGLSVHTVGGIELGQVIRVFNSGANDLLVVQGEKEHLIPFIRDHFVLSIDIPLRRIVVDWDPEF